MKQQRMQSIVDHYHTHGGGGGGGGGSWEGLRKWSSTEGQRATCGGGGGGGGDVGAYFWRDKGVSTADLVDLSSRGDWIFHNVPPQTASALSATQGISRAGR